MQQLIIVESPVKAKKIQQFVGNDYIVLSSSGHICDLAKGGQYGIGIDIKNEFKTRYLLMEDKVNILNNIINAAEKCDAILLGMDKDREGESIAMHLQRYLSSTNKPIKRIKFGEITKNSIIKAIEEKQDIDVNMCNAQETRRILDRIVGFMVSPYLIKYYGQNLSAGRVQSVAVRMIMDREKEIEKFKPEEFWNIFVKFKNNRDEKFIAKYQGRPKNKEQANTIVDKIKKNKDFFVLTAKSQKKKEQPPPPLTTASLQQYMARKYSFEPERTMTVAQNLYENGFCSYIRTDSTRISDEAIQSVREWIKENNFDLPKKPNIYKTNDTAQDAHECIRPTNIKTLPDSTILTDDEKNVYTAIWQHFVACQMSPAIWNTLNIVIASTNDTTTFSTTGKALEYKGYLDIFGNIDPGKIEIPNLNKNDVVISFDTKTEQKFTQPPPRFNDATILKELEEKQIGRPATYAEIIKKITNRNYVEKNGSTTYKPTELGKKITDILINNFSFMDYDFTSNLELSLDKISSGKISKNSVLYDFFDKFNTELLKSYSTKSENNFICRKCKNSMLEYNGKFGKYFLCINVLCKNTEKFDFFNTNSVETRSC